MSEKWFKYYKKYNMSVELKIAKNFNIYIQVKKKNEPVLNIFENQNVIMEYFFYKINKKIRYNQSLTSPNIDMDYFFIKINPKTFDFLKIAWVLRDELNVHSYTFKYFGCFKESKYLKNYDHWGRPAGYEFDYEDGKYHYEDDYNDNDNGYDDIDDNYLLYDSLCQDDFF